MGFAIPFYTVTSSCPLFEILTVMLVELFLLPSDFKRTSHSYVFQL